MMGSEVVINTQEKHLEVRKVTFVHLLVTCSVTIGRKSRRIENRTENITMPYVNLLNDPTSEVMFAILILPLKKDADNQRMFRGSHKGEQR